MRNITLSIAFVLSFSAFGVGQSANEMAKAREAEQLATKAYKEKAYGEFLAQMKIANAARSNHPRLIYNLASAYAVNGQSEESLSSLDRLARMGLYFAIEKDNDFSVLTSLDRYKSIVAKFADNQRPVNQSSRATTAPDKTLIVEGVAYHKRTQTFYLASVHQRKIIAIDKNGLARDFSSESDGLWGVFGIHIDAERGWLWITTMATPAMKGYQQTARGRSGIFRYDLKSGNLLKKYLLPVGERHALGDLIIDRSGRLYATDSAASIIYTIDPKKDEIEEFLRTDRFDSLQGLALSGETLFVADYSKGIFRIDTATKTVIQLTPTEDIALLGIDGLYEYKGKLIAIQNGINPHRVAAFSIVGDKITSQQTLEANHSDFDEPTLGVLSGDHFYFNANSQFPHVNEKGELAIDKLRPPVVLKIDLKKALAK